MIFQSSASFLNLVPENGDEQIEQQLVIPIWNGDCSTAVLSSPIETMRKIIGY